MFDIPDLRIQLKKMTTKHDNFQDFQLKHHFAALGNKVLILNAMRMNGESNRKARILLAIEDASRPLA
jgi:hypothetical protein